MVFEMSSIGSNFSSYKECLERVLGISANESALSKPSSDTFGSFDDDKIKKTTQKPLKAIQKSILDQKDSQNKKRKFSKSVSKSAQNIETLKTISGKKRKASEEIEHEAKPVNRRDAICKALNSALPNVLIKTVTHYDDENDLLDDLVDYQEKIRHYQHTGSLATSASALAQSVDLLSIRDMFLEDIKEIKLKLSKYALVNVVENLAKYVLFNKIEFLKDIPLSEKTIKALKDLQKSFSEVIPANSFEAVELATYIYIVMLPDHVQEFDKQEMKNDADEFVRRGWIGSRDDDDQPSPEEALAAAKRQYYRKIARLLTESSALKSDWYFSYYRE